MTDQTRAIRCPHGRVATLTSIADLAPGIAGHRAATAPAKLRLTPVTGLTGPATDLGRTSSAWCGPSEGTDALSRSGPRPCQGPRRSSPCASHPCPARPRSPCPQRPCRWCPSWRSWRPQLPFLRGWGGAPLRGRPGPVRGGHRSHRQQGTGAGQKNLRPRRHQICSSHLTTNLHSSLCVVARHSSSLEHQ